MSCSMAESRVEFDAVINVAESLESIKNQPYEEPINFQSSEINVSLWRIVN